jgi:hypothetical protein
MTTIKIISTIVIIFLLLAFMYLFFQIFRNNLVYNIRAKWIEIDDKRRYKYSYGYMQNPSESNYFGLRIPKESHYK